MNHSKLQKLLMFAFVPSLVISFAFCKNLPEDNTPQVNDYLTTKVNVSDDAFNRALRNYNNYCAGCHGWQVEEFAEKNWLSDESHQKVFGDIKDGIQEFGMPAFRRTFEDEEIEELVDFMTLVIEGEREINTGEKTSLSGIVHSEAQDFRVDTIIRGFNIIWGMTWLPNGDIIFTERAGKIYRYSDGQIVGAIENSPKVIPHGQGGMMDIELHPDYKENGWIYISYSYQEKGAGKNVGNAAIVRARLEGNKFVDNEIIFKAEPALRSGRHFGSRIEFDEEGYMYFSVGDRGRRDKLPQSLDNHSGKIHRTYDDGSIPPSNPFVNKSGAMPTIFSYGHRNPQGVSLNPLTGDIWTHEHGPKGGDEVNIIRKGDNYGWPVISFGINYNGTKFTDDTAKAGMEQPVIYWTPSIAPCGMDFIEGDRYPGWKGDLMVGSLRFKYVARCVIEDDKIVHQERLLENSGRVRDVKLSPDGYLHVAIEKPGMVLKLVPVNE